MDTSIFDFLYQELKEYARSDNFAYSVDVLPSYPTKPKYPVVIFSEIDNTRKEEYNTDRERVSRLAFRVDIYAKSIKCKEAVFIGRDIARLLDRFLTKNGLRQLSFSSNDSPNEYSIYHIIMVYRNNLYENKKILY